MLSLDKVSKYINDKRILKEISFDVGVRSIFGYLGPNGAGKTTTIRIILGLYEQYTGAIRFGNVSIANFDKSTMGFMLETDGLYGNMTLLDNLKLYTGIYQLDFSRISGRIGELLAKFDLAEAKNEHVFTFSHGMRQKASFLRSVIHDPDLLVLDEPFNGLDPDMQMVLREYLVHLSKEEKTTIFFSTHNLYEVERLCDQIAIIKNGEIKLTGHVEDMLDKTCDNLEKLYFHCINE
jgi:ABC-2 type transport system ATP-binding protein